MARKNCIFRWLVVCVWVGVCLLSWTCPALSDGAYTLVDLGPGVLPIAISEENHVIGQLESHGAPGLGQVAEGWHSAAFWWHEGNFDVLPDLGGNSWHAYGITHYASQTLIVGSAYLEEFGEAPVAWIGDPYSTGFETVMLEVPDAPYAWATSANSAGMVVGNYVSQEHETYGFIVCVSAAPVSPLPVCPVGDDSRMIADINDNMQIVGNFQTPEYVSYGYVGAMTETYRPDCSFGFAFQDIGSLGGSYCHPTSINDQGVVVGSSNNPLGESRGFVWNQDSMTELGTFGGSFSQAQDINNLNHIVGYSSDENYESKACLWKDGEMIDLNSLVPAGETMVLQTAEGINDRGFIVGWGQIEGEMHGYVLFPPSSSEATPTPTSVPMDTPTNTPAPETRFDFNDDGIIDVEDALMLLSAYGTNNPTFDLNGDGIVNADDMFLFSKYWNPSPTISD